ncbi:dynamin-binding protein-like isoform X2 [Physella acuta]|uniref:dynamin-binding protein-like isoform X2 n=1 Tax=Physella acuta TaxID=109671 RepID=UPI0027DB3A2B|nr:dynamin-binding protein-like isoform X2 [Physella acuta]XP_059156461.1 dynamin-binding protein-like isoform X2 [Physella acuta]
MHLNIGDYVKVIYDFVAEAVTDLSIHCGDIVQITGQKIFLALEDFPAEQDEDLDISKGDIIVGLEPIDEDWWRGKNGPLKGIFPLSFVVELSSNPSSSNPSSSNPSSSNPSSSNPSSSNPSSSNPSSSNPSSSNPSSSNPSSVPVAHLARALYDVIPQLDGELALKTGDVLEVTQSIDSDWFYGRLAGREGLVSAVCVEILPAATFSYTSENTRSHDTEITPYTSENTRSHDTEITPYTSENTRSHDTEITPYTSENTRSHDTEITPYTSENTRSHDTEITPYGRVIYPFGARHAGELSLREFELVNLIQHVDQDWMLGEVDGHQGLFPTAFVDIIVDCPDTHNLHTQPHTHNLHTQPHTHNLHTQPHTHNLHPQSHTHNLHPQSHTHNLHPQSHTHNLHPQSHTHNLHPQSHTHNLHTQPHVGWMAGHDLGLVLHDFTAQLEGDVSVSEGETIEVLQQLDANWLDIRTETGDRGIIPRNHIQLIGAWPPDSPANLSLQPANPSLQPANPSLQPANPSLQPANPSLQPANPSVQPANPSLQPANPSLQPANPSVQPANPSLQPANPSLQPAILLVEQSYESTGLKKPPSLVQPGPKPSIAPKPTLSKSWVRGPTQNTVHTPKANKSHEPKNIDTNGCIGLSKVRSIDKAFVNSAFQMDEGQMVKPHVDEGQMVKPHVDEGQMVKPHVDEGQMVKPHVDEGQMVKPHVDEGQMVKPHVDEGQMVKPHVDEGQMVKPHVDEGQMVKPHVDEGQMVKPHVDEGQMVKPHVDEGQMVKPHVDEGQMVKPHPPHRPPPRRPPPHRPPPHALELVEKFSTVPRLPSGRDPRLASCTEPRPATGKLVPKRPAPRAPESRPRPVSLPSPLEVGDLIRLSPTDVKSPREEDQQRATNKSGHQLMFDLQKSQECTGTCEDSLDLGTNNLNGFHEEHQLKETLLSLVSNESRLEQARLLAAQQEGEGERRREEERKKKEEDTERKREQRKKVIDEIVETEKDYLHSLHLCLEIFLEEKKAPAGMDLNLVLGNMEEIADVSQKLLANLESCVSGKDFAEQCLGPCFTFYAEDMKNTYAPYCRNHDEVLTMMERYNQQPEMREYFQDKLEQMREHTNVFDISGVLIKPVQRILKYPLLLNELLKNTEDGHCDHQELETAIKAMTDVAKAINEYKRRKDLVYKYKKLNDETLGDKISKLTFHSIKKKSSRIRGRLSTNFGISLQMKDERFEEEEVKFRNLEKAVKIFFRSVLLFLDQSQETIKCQELVAMDIKEFFAGKDSLEAKKLSEVVNKVVQLYSQMKEKMRLNVEEPLHVLVGLFNAPGHVIEKRFDKLLDYNHQLGKAENDKELVQAKHDYEAMNCQLLDELPKFYTLAFQLFKFCLSAFVLARRDFMDQCLKESCSLLELPSMKKTNIMEVFSIRHTAVFDQMSLLTFIPRGFNPRVDTIKADKAKLKGRLEAHSTVIQTTSSPGCQAESQMNYLLHTYPGRLYQASCTYNGMDLMDIALTQGTVVGVVKDLDPMGNKERWFVDDGVNKGFVPSHILSPYSPDPSGQDDLQTMLDLEPSVVLTGNDGRATFHAGRDEAFQDFKYYCALYDFTSRHPNEASLKAGHPVSVLAFKDLDGNPEWWLVDSAGCRGYAPANYLAPMPDME